jgi:hypothetical protein
MTTERCEECGFNGDDWTDKEALDAVRQLPARWSTATSGVEQSQAIRRPIPQTWSIAEYANHVREVLFGMRFLIDTAATASGTDLGASPPSSFEEEPRDLDLARALDRIESEATLLADRLAELTNSSWDDVVIVDGEQMDAHWVSRHAVHDATHHLMDVSRIQAALSRPC